MATGGLTHSQFATKLIVEGCLANIAGNVQGQMPVVPVPMTELQRADLGLKQGGVTYYYPLDPNGVVFDLQGSTAIVWYTGNDCGSALATFEQALKRAHPNVRQRGDRVHPDDPEARHRAYEVDLGGSRRALVDVEYPAPGAPPKRFWVRVTAFARK
jgi:hypothetical protein